MMLPAAGPFVLIGGQPDWVGDIVRRDEQGCILTGADLSGNGRLSEAWPRERPPLLLATSVPWLFAAGDVRCGSTKRVASAVGEEAIAVQLLHQHLSSPAPPARREAARS